MSRLLARHRILVVLCSLASWVPLAGQTPTVAQDPRIGTWTLNLKRSQFVEGSAPQMQVRRLQARADGFVVFTQIGLDAQGNPTFIQTTYKLDGKGISRIYPSFTG
jgi:hypothetical protein